MEIHIGREIEKIYQKSGMKLSEFAKRINTSTRNIYSIFARSEIKTDQLQKISEVLDFDFFLLFTSQDLMRVEEARSKYAKSTNRITVSIELDGDSSTLKNHIEKIKAINSALEKL